MLFSKFAEYLLALDKTTKRLEITDILSKVFKELREDEIQNSIYLLLGRLGPKFNDTPFQMADKMVIKAISEAYKTDEDIILKQYKKVGDLGIVAEVLSKNKTSNFSVNEVFEKLLEIAKEEGQESVLRKVTKTADLLKLSNSISSKYIVRITLGKLRLGFSDKTIIDALSWSIDKSKNYSKLINEYYQVMPDPGMLAKKVKAEGVISMKNKKPTIGIPVIPMLAQRIKGINEVFEKMGEVLVEPKYDGLRLQIHFEKSKKIIKAYSRNLIEISEMFPEIIKVTEEIKAENAILDCEVVGVNKTLQKMVDFQTTMTRRRKHDIAKKGEGLPIKFCIFDCIFLNSQNLMDLALVDRKNLLKSIILPSRYVEYVDYESTSDEIKIKNLNLSMRKKGYEGIMLKKRNSKYVSGRLGFRWVKIKEVEGSGKLPDTIDGIIMGFTAGKGKRADFGLGQFLVGIKDDGYIKTITKVGTGLTDEEFRSFQSILKKAVVKEAPHNYLFSKNYTPDFWVSPVVVVEIAGDDLTKSPTHTSGYAIRFPRLVKIRKDKSVGEITTKKEIEELYKIQFN